MDIKQIPYFAFEVNAWDAWKERISLSSDNIEALLKELENGENLFEVVSKLKRERFHGFSIKYGLFERRNEVNINDEKFVSTKGYKQVGKLLVPHYRIVTREKLESMSKDFSTDNFDRKIYVKVLDKFPKIDKFYHEGTSNYTPLDTNKILVLNKNQL